MSLQTNTRGRSQTQVNIKLMSIPENNKRPAHYGLAFITFVSRLQPLLNEVRFGRGIYLLEIEIIKVNEISSRVGRICKG
ncbi:hypothetical protein HDF15_004558 [Granulicella mallensis]|uniref:Uncharacterized protein n=1 Tax=Granulicella mallensis TaxID=940614 RepID=A0A7W8EC24_9BACT|nr:hypothetical protein [Granulicella mallensis]